MNLTALNPQVDEMLLMNLQKIKMQVAKQAEKKGGKKGGKGGGKKGGKGGKKGAKKGKGDKKGKKKGEVGARCVVGCCFSARPCRCSGAGKGGWIRTGVSSMAINERW